MSDAIKRVLMSAVDGPIFVVGLVFLTVGTLCYWQGFLYNGLALVMLIVQYFSVKKNTAQIKERLEPGEQAESWDMKYWIYSRPLFFVTIILACLDGGRFKWSQILPLSVYIIAIAVFVIGNLIAVWARMTNKFYSTVVRIQKERGHAVCKEGPYRYVRHPGYLGVLLITLVTPLLLGSLWAMFSAIIAAIFLIVRTALEDRTLEIKLDGYLEYKGKVKYRLMPYLW